jgi:type VI secretion system secreted protein Hcp
MAVDMFLTIKNVDGETKDDKKSKEKAIDVLAWSWGMQNAGKFHTGGGGGAGKVSVQDLSVTKYVDSASNRLLTMCAKGEPAPEATLVVRKAGKDPLEYILIKMTNVLVTNVMTGGSTGDERLQETVTLNFAEVHFDYVEQKEDGSGQAPKSFKMDIAKYSFK